MLDHLQIISEVMRFLSVSDRKEACLVCHRWYEASLDPMLAKNVVMRVNVNSASGFIALSKFANRPMSHLVQVLSLKGSSELSHRALATLLSHCHNLESLDLSCCNNLFLSGQLFKQPQDLAKVKDAMGNVKDLNISSIRHMADSTFNRLVSLFPNLRKLSLAGCQIVFHSDLYYPHGTTKFENTAVLTFKNILGYIKRNAKKLTSLDLSRTALYDEALSLIVNAPGLSLEEIAIRGCKEVTNAGITELCCKHTSLLVLDFSLCMDLTDVSLKAVGKYLPSVKSICMKKCGRLTDASVVSLAEMEYLESLQLNECFYISCSGFIRGLCSPKLRRLTFLNLSGCTGINDAFVSELCKSANYLTHLDLASCNRITDFSVHCISKHLIYLRFLSLAWCPKISDFGLLGLVDENAADFVPEEGLCRCTRKNLVTNLFNKPEVKKTKKPVELTEVEAKCRLDNDEGMPNISNLTKLRHLDLSLCSKITNTSVKHALIFSELQVLRLNSCHGITDDGFVAIAINIPCLEQLHISQCEHITDISVNALSENLKRLSTLDMSGCDLLTSASMAYLTSYAKRLKNLNVSMCNGITLKSVDQLENSRYGQLLVQKRLVGGADNYSDFML